MKGKVGVDGALPIPAFSEFHSHAAFAEHVFKSSLITNVQKEGFWSGKVLDVDRGVLIQKIGRGTETVTHDASKLSTPVKVGDVIDIKYVGGVGVVTVMDKGLDGAGR
jgi:hypothetical protein